MSGTILAYLSVAKSFRKADRVLSDASGSVGKLSLQDPFPDRSSRWDRWDARVLQAVSDTQPPQLLPSVLRKSVSFTSPYQEVDENRLKTINARSHMVVVNPEPADRAAKAYAKLDLRQTLVDSSTVRQRRAWGYRSFSGPRADHTAIPIERFFLGSRRRAVPAISIGFSVSGWISSDQKRTSHTRLNRERLA